MVAVLIRLAIGALAVFGLAIVVGIILGVVASRFSDGSDDPFQGER